MNAFETWFQKCGFRRGEWHSVKECAEALNVSEPYIYMLLNGSRKSKGRRIPLTPGNKTLRMMAKVEHKLTEGERV